MDEATLSTYLVIAPLTLIYGAIWPHLNAEAHPILEVFVPLTLIHGPIPHLVRTHVLLDLHLISIVHLLMLERVQPERTYVLVYLACLLTLHQRVDVYLLIEVAIARLSTLVRLPDLACYDLPYKVSSPSCLDFNS